MGVSYEVACWLVGKFGGRKVRDLCEIGELVEEDR